MNADCKPYREWTCPECGNVVRTDIPSQSYVRCGKCYIKQNSKIVKMVETTNEVKLT